MRKLLLRDCLRIAKDKNSGHPEKTFRHFTFIIQGNKLVEYGYNRTHDPLTQYGYPSWSKVHSENTAYKKAKGLLNKDIPFEAVNIRLTKGGKLKLSQPCPCCFNYLKTCGCHSIYFSTTTGFAKLVL
jgi:hypothetical protein